MPRRRCRLPMIAAITARQRPPPWRRWGLSRPWQRRVSDTMLRRPRALPHPPPLKSVWRRRCGHRQGVRCTRDAKPSWNRYWARSKQSGVSGGSWCAAWTTSVVNGGWCVGPLICSSSGATRVRRSRLHPQRWHRPQMLLCRVSYRLRTDRFSPRSRRGQHACQAVHPDRMPGLGSQGYMRSFSDSLREEA